MTCHPKGGCMQYCFMVHCKVGDLCSVEMLMFKLGIPPCGVGQDNGH